MYVSMLTMCRRELFKHMLRGGCNLYLNGQCTPTVNGRVLTERRLDLFCKLRGSWLRLVTMKRLLDVLDVCYKVLWSISELTDVLRNSLASLVKECKNAISKMNAAQCCASVKDSECNAKVINECNWPQIVAEDLKDKLVSKFYDVTSLLALRKYCCAVCSEMFFKGDMCEHLLPSTDDPLQLLRRKYPSELLNPFASDDQLNGLMLEPSGLVYTDDGCVSLQCFKLCYSVLYVDNHLSKFAIANDLYVVNILPKLSDLMVVEECMITRHRAKVFVMQLNDVSDKGSAKHQRELKGHIIVHPSFPEKLSSLLPHPIKDVVCYMCVLFSGSHKPI